MFSSMYICFYTNTFVFFFLVWCRRITETQIYFLHHVIIISDCTLSACVGPRQLLPSNFPVFACVCVCLNAGCKCTGVCTAKIKHASSHADVLMTLFLQISRSHKNGAAPLSTKRWVNLMATLFCNMLCKSRSFDRTEFHVDFISPLRCNAI